jgi:Zn-dependent protease with chaperone function
VTQGWPATRFDGRSGAGDVVVLHVDGPTLVITSRASLDRIPLEDVGVSEAFEAAPRMLALPGGHTLEVPDPLRTLPAALEAAGKRPSWVVRMQRAWPVVILALLLTVAGGVWTYVEGLPIAARAVAHALPPAFDRRIGENLLELLDQNVLEASTLDAGRRAQITERFGKAAAVAAPGVDVRLEFRAGQVNAFALPGGIIVLFDELVELADADDRVLGVLGHELGHIVHRHSTRQLMQALGLAAIAGVVWGDFSSLVSNVPLVLGLMRYGRGFEEEADEFAIALLRANGLSPRPLLDFFESLEGSDKGRGRDPIPDFLSTHPDVGSRVERLRRESEAYERSKSR